MASMAISTKARSVGALLLLVAVLVGTGAPGVHAATESLVTPLDTVIQNLCPVNVTVTLSGSNPLNVTLGPNGTVTLPTILFDVLTNNDILGIVLNGTLSEIPVAVTELVNALLASLIAILNALGPIGQFLILLLKLLIELPISVITINCSDTSCGTAGLLVANASVTVETFLNATAKVCI